MLNLDDRDAVERLLAGDDVVGAAIAWRNAVRATHPPGTKLSSVSQALADAVGKLEAVLARQGRR